MTLMRKCGKHGAKLRWLFGAIFDAASTGRLHREDVSARSIIDKNRVSAVDVILYKYQLHSEYMGPVLSRQSFAPVVQNQLRVVFQSHDVFRTKFGWPGMSRSEYIVKPVCFEIDWSRVALPRMSTGSNGQRHGELSNWRTGLSDAESAVPIDEDRAVRIDEDLESMWESVFGEWQV